MGSTRKLLLVVGGSALALAWGCGGHSSGANAEGGASGASDTPGVSGKPSMNATAGDDAGGAFGSGGTNVEPTNGGGAHAGAASAGAPPAGAPSGGTSNAGAPGAGAHAGGASGAAGSTAAGAGGVPALPDPILQIKPSPGCGKARIQTTAAFVKYSIVTSGTKADNAADSVTGPWTYTRDYYVWLPPTYDDQKAYPLVVEGPGCGQTGTDVDSLSPSNDTNGVGVNGTVVRVGLTPPPNAIGHPTTPNQGCFDDHEGDDSVEWPFYEALIDKLKTEVCYDQNRVFAAGHGSGGWLANELACRYAGNTAGYAIRGAASQNGYLPTDAKFAPTCSDAPMAGLWINHKSDGDAFDLYQYAIARAMKVNHCTMGTGLSDAPMADFTIGGGNAASTCKMILGCPAEYPLVACILPASSSGSSDIGIVNPGFATFLLGLEAH